jgi:O-antigen/teichoic acid export membrane protein
MFRRVPVLVALRSRLAGNRLLQAAGRLAGAAAIGQALMVAVMPLLTRLYTPSEFGMFAAFSAAMGLVLVISSLRYEQAIPLTRNTQSARSMLMSALIINATTALVALVVLLFAGGEIARRLGTPELAGYLLLLPLAVLGAGSFRALNLWVLRSHNYNLAAQTKLLQSVVNIIIQVAAGFAGFGAIGLIIGHISGFTAGGARMLRGVFVLSAIPPKDHRRRAGVLLKAHVNFPRFDVPASLVDMLGLQLPNLVLLALFGPAVAGAYFLAERMLTAPMGIVSQALAQTILANARETNQQRQLMRQTVRVIIGLSVLLSVPVVVVVVGGEQLFSTIFDESWRQAGIYASWLVTGFALQFIYSSISTTLMATEGQKTNLFIHLMLLIFKVTALVVSYDADNPLSSIIALSIATIIGGIFSIGVLLFHVSRTARKQPGL